jgi:hypothetical protein
MLREDALTRHTCTQAIRGNLSDLYQVLQVRVSCSIPGGPLEGCVGNVNANKVPIVHGRAQQRVDQICPAANV